MRRISILFLFLALFGQFIDRAYGEAKEPFIYQVSTIAALEEGRYEGQVTFGELKNQGNLGIGTVTGLDGEMVALDGRFYQIRSDKRAYEIADSAKTPFAIVTTLSAQEKTVLPAVKDMKELTKALDAVMPVKESLCAIRIDGTFDYLKVRSVPGQSPPYPKLQDVLKDQIVFELKQVEGTLVGFRFPPSMNGVNVPGYHFHFITSDKKTGGHVLDCRIERPAAKSAVLHDLHLRLPAGPRADAQ